MRRDDEMAAKCGAWAAAGLCLVGLVLLTLSVAVVAVLMTDGDIRG